MALVALAILATSSSTFAANAAPLQTVDTAGSSREISRVYGNICLNIFPDVAAIAGVAKSNGLVPLTNNEMAYLLGGGQGFGWHYTTETRSTYTVTVEPPPHQACSISRIYTAVPPAAVEEMKDELTAWVQATGRGSLKSSPPQTSFVDGAAVGVQSMYTTDWTGVTKERYTALTSSIGGGQELRLVRLVLPQAK